MDFSLILPIAVILLNLAFLSIGFIVQEWESKTSRIPPRSKEFLYLQDLPIIMIGDFIGLSLIDSSLALIISEIGLPSSAWLLTSFILSIAGTIFFHKQCLSLRHIPDVGYPKIGKASLTGLGHLPYVVFQFWLILISLWYFINVRTPFLLITALGIILYCLTYLLDLKKGKYWSYGRREK